MEILKKAIDFLKEGKEAGNIPEWLAQDWIVILTGIVLGITILSSLWKLGTWLYQWRQRRFLSKDLAPYFTKLDVYKATKNYIPTKYQNVAPSEDDEPGRKYIASAKAKLIPLFINQAFDQSKDDNKYYLILADAGMGKTTFMINLYLRYKKKWFIKSRRVDIKLFPLGNPHVLEEIKNIDNDVKKDTILLLDALDDDAAAVKNYQERLQQIMKEVWRFREIVITCRTQFFPSREEEPTETGYYKLSGEGGEYHFQKLYVSVFDNKDIKRYLHKRFNLWNPFTWKKLKRAKAIAEKSPNLLVRPMLLSHIQELVDGKKEYEFTYEIYEVLIQKWIDREANKPGIREKFGSIEEFKKALLAFSQSLAINLYNNQSERGGLFIYKDETIATDSGIQLSDFEDNIEVSMSESQWRSRSLINRNAEGNYKFSHKSVLEYFLAKEAIENPEFTDKLEFEGLDTAKAFCEEMVIGEVLKNAEGIFIPPNQKKEIPLNQIGGKSKIHILKITSASRVNLVLLKNLNFKVVIPVIILIDKAAFDIMYLLYLVLFIRPRDLRNRPDLQNRLGRMDWRGRNPQSLVDKLRQGDLLDLLDIVCRRYMLIDSLAWQRLLTRLDLFALLDQLDQLGKLDRLDRVSQLDSQIIRELREANNFIINCKMLEKAMPDVEFYY